MAYLSKTRFGRRMLAVAASTLGVLVLSVAPATAEPGLVEDICPPSFPLVEDVCALTDGLVNGVTGVMDGMLAPISPIVSDITGLVEPVTGALLPATDGVTEGLLPGASLGLQGDTSGASASATVEAVGKAATEVLEPAAPDADGRIAGLVPAGVNIPGLRSQSGLTLQPFQPPVVSMPYDFDSPRVAADGTVQSQVAAEQTPLTMAGEILLGTSDQLPLLSVITAAMILLGTALMVRRRRRARVAEIAAQAA